MAGGWGERGTREIYFCLWQPRGSPGGGRRRGEAAAAASAPFAPPDRGRRARRTARAREPRRREGRRRHHVLPGQEEHPADHGESGRRRLPARPLPPSRVPPRRGRGGSGPRSGPPGGTGTRGWGVESGGQSSRRGGRHPDGATLGFGGKQNKEETQTLARGIEDLVASFPTRPVVPKDAPPGVSVRAAPGRGSIFFFFFLSKVAFGGAGGAEMTPSPGVPGGSPAAPLSQLQPQPQLQPRGRARRAGAWTWVPSLCPRPVPSSPAFARFLFQCVTLGTGQLAWLQRGMTTVVCVFLPSMQFAFGNAVSPPRSRKGLSVPSRP